MQAVLWETVLEETACADPSFGVAEFEAAAVEVTAGKAAAFEAIALEVSAVEMGRLWSKGWAVEATGVPSRVVILSRRSSDLRHCPPRPHAEMAALIATTSGVRVCFRYWFRC